MITLENLFGEGSYQDVEKVVIQKNSIGLSASTHNSAESIFAGILEHSRKNFHGMLTANGEVVRSGIEPIEFDNSSLYEFLKIYYSRNEILGSNFISVFKIFLLILENGY
jgi:hypothetical protein